MLKCFVDYVINIPYRDPLSQQERYFPSGRRFFRFLVTYTSITFWVAIVIGNVVSIITFHVAGAATYATIPYHDTIFSLAPAIANSVCIFKGDIVFILFYFYYFYYFIFLQIIFIIVG